MQKNLGKIGGGGILLVFFFKFVFGIFFKTFFFQKGLGPRGGDY